MVQRPARGSDEAVARREAPRSHQPSAISYQLSAISYRDGPVRGVRRPARLGQLPQKRDTDLTDGAGRADRSETGMRPRATTRKEGNRPPGRPPRKAVPLIAVVIARSTLPRDERSAPIRSIRPIRIPSHGFSPNEHRLTPGCPGLIKPLIQPDLASSAQPSGRRPCQPAGSKQHGKSEPQDPTSE